MWQACELRTLPFDKLRKCETMFIDQQEPSSLKIS